jgi:hypothetical protein
LNLFKEENLLVIIEEYIVSKLSVENQTFLHQISKLMHKNNRLYSSLKQTEIRLILNKLIHIVSFPEKESSLYTQFLMN